MNNAAIIAPHAPPSVRQQSHISVVQEASMDSEMMAVVATGYGSTDVLTMRSVPRPVPKANEVLVKVHATNVSAADSMMRRGDPAYARLFLGLRRPKAAVPGTGFAGVVERVGTNVTRFRVGDAIFGEAGLGLGSHAEFVCVPEDGAVIEKPGALSFEDASTMCDGPLTSFNFLRRIANVQPGDKVLINGASGSLGTAAVQIARSMGAEVTGVCSTANIDLVTSLGAHHVIDYNKEDFTSHPARYDVIYDTVGKSSFRKCKRALVSDGMYLSPVLSLPLLLSVIWTMVFGNKSAKFDATGMREAPELRVFLGELVSLVEKERLRVVTECVFDFADIANAHHHVDSGRKRGNVVVRL